MKSDSRDLKAFRVLEKLSKKVPSSFYDSLSSGLFRKNLQPKLKHLSKVSS